MRNLNKVFAVSALSLAVSTSYADGTDSSDCSSMNDVNSFSFWENPVLLTTCVLGNEPPAAGPVTGKTEVGSPDVGRHDSEKYEPILDSSPLHIALPNPESETVTYFASWSDSHSYHSETGSQNESAALGVGSLDIDVDALAETVFVQAYDVDGVAIWSFSFPDATPNADQYESHSNYFYDYEGNGFHTNNESYTNVGEYPIYEHTHEGEYVYQHLISIMPDYDTYTYELLQGVWGGWIGAGISQNSGDGTVYSSSSEYDYHPFVSGVKTPLADIQSLISSQVTATYRGYSQFNYQRVEIDVDFGAKSFDANIDDGFYRRKGPGGNYQDMSFTAKGDIQGRELISTSVQASDTNNITGFMQGSFVGEGASAIIGAYDVTKEGTRMNDAFVTAKEGVAAGGS